MRGVGRKARPSSVLTLHVCADGQAFAVGYPKRSPVLSVRLGSSVVLLGTAREDTVGADDVAFARELARAAAKFAEFCERSYRGLPNGADVPPPDTVTDADGRAA
ncbi:MAG TPA: hypothetical protein VGL93_07680 [Streptosporangiaceae bacterium]|jgi:hypothetical protein